MKLTRLTEPTVEPVPLAEMKAHLRVDHADEDATIGAYTDAAISYVEQHCNLALAQAQYAVRLDADSRLPLTIPVWPVESVDAIAFEGESPETAVDAAAYALLPWRPSRLVGSTAAWPSAPDSATALRITVTAGWPGDGNSPEAWAGPASVKQALKLLVGHWFASRETVVIGTITAELPFAVKALLDQQRIYL